MRTTLRRGRETVDRPPSRFRKDRDERTRTITASNKKLATGVTGRGDRVACVFSGVRHRYAPMARLACGCSPCLSVADVMEDKTNGSREQ